MTFAQTVWFVVKKQCPKLQRGGTFFFLGVTSFKVFVKNLAEFIDSLTKAHKLLDRLSDTVKRPLQFRLHEVTSPTDGCFLLGVYINY